MPQTQVDQCMGLEGVAWLLQWSAYNQSSSSNTTKRNATKWWEGSHMACLLRKHAFTVLQHVYSTIYVRTCNVGLIE